MRIPKRKYKIYLMIQLQLDLTSLPSWYTKRLSNEKETLNKINKIQGF